MLNTTGQNRDISTADRPSITGGLEGFTSDDLKDNFGEKFWEHPTYKTLLGMSGQIKEISDKIKKAQEQAINLKREEDKFKKELDKYNHDLRRTDIILMGMTVAVSIAFVTAFYLMSFDLIKEKDLYLKYNDLYKEYSDKNSQLRDVIYRQELGISNLKNELEVLRAKNSYLK